MSYTSLRMALAASLICAGAAFAQEAQPEAEAPATDGGVPLETGQPAPAQTPPPPPQPYTKETFGDWSHLCTKLPNTDSEPCELFQRLKDANGNDTAQISVVPLLNNDQVVAAVEVVAPLETLLTRQLRISVDGADGKIYPFTWCNPVGCFARLGFTAEDVASFKRGNTAQMVIFPVRAPNNPVEVTISLTGFTAGYDAMQTYVEGLAANQAQQ